MRQLTLLIILTLVCCATTKAQIPHLRINNIDSSKVYLKKLQVDVKIVSNIAITTMEMTFCNNTTKVLEGELTIPLPEGVNINRYALDINGKMREAVPVEKEIGQIAFETTIKKRVDPALLEKVSGNNFRTRIYPLPAGGCRRIIIAYQETLKSYISSNKAAVNTSENFSQLIYNLPLNGKKIIPAFEFKISVYGKYMPEIGTACKTNLKFETTDRQALYVASTTQNDFKPSGSFQINMPQLGEKEEVLMQEKDGKYYFLINHQPAFEKKGIAMPNQIHLIWDNSFSQYFSDHKKEIDFITAVMKEMKTGTIYLSTIGYNYDEIGSFEVINGANKDLIQKLEKIVYDGATNFSKIKYGKAKTAILISDGLNTYNNTWTEPNNNVTLYSVTANVSSDYAELRQRAALTGGNLINLNTGSVANGVGAMLNQPFRLIKVTHTTAITDVNPPNTIVQGNVTVAGVSSSAQSELILHYGYGNTTTVLTKVNLDYNTQVCNDIDLEKFWAQAKIDELNYNYQQNKKTISVISKKYNIVTENTSLIILDDVADYVRYEIVPPVELRSAYDSILKAKTEPTIAKKKTFLEAAKNMAQNLKEWQTKDFRQKLTVYVMHSFTGKPIKNAKVIFNNQTVLTDENGIAIAYEIKEAQVKVQMEGFNTQSFKLFEKTDDYKTVYLVNPTETQKRVTLKSNSRKTGAGSANTISGTVVNENGEPLASASILLKTTNKSVATNIEGYFIFNSNTAKETFTVSYVGYQTLTTQLVNGGKYNIVLTPHANYGEAVVVTGYGSGSSRAEDDSLPIRYLSYAAEEQPNRTTANFGVNAPATNNANAPIQVYDALELTAGNGGSQGLTGTFVTVKDALLRDKKLNQNSNTLKKKTTIQVVKIKNNEPYFLLLEKSVNPYQTYLTLREKYLTTPQFYFDVAKYFLAQKKTDTGLMILSTVADLNLNDHELYKMLAYELKAQQQFTQTLFVTKKVLDWRPQEPQSYRDYALALSNLGLHQNALDTLYYILTKEFDEQTVAGYNGIEETILFEINKILQTETVNRTKLDSGVVVTLSSDVRVVLNWNMNDSDMDLWVFDPNNEKCFYSHNATKIGGRLSDDFTAGYGPEQFVLKTATKGKYQIKLHYYGDGQQKIVGSATVMAEVFTNYGQPNEMRQIITLQMKSETNKEGIFVGEFEFK